MAHDESGPASPRFQPGDRVRVKYGVADPDFPDIPLGGWAGTVETSEQVDDQITYEVEWDRTTLVGMHPVYRNRCARDGLDPTILWLGEEDLEPDNGTPVPLEQPTGIVTPPLSEKDRDDRVRKALGLTHDDPLPEISPETLLAYHRYLTANLTFPFIAYCGEEEVGPFSRKRSTVTVTALHAPVRGSPGVEDGLFCTVRGRDDETVFPLADVEVRSKKNDPNSRLVSDYAYWFHNWPSRDEREIDREDDSLPGVTTGSVGAYRDRSDVDREDNDRESDSGHSPSSRSVLIMTALVLGVGGSLLGATIGAALRTLNGAGLAALIGGVPPAVTGALVLGRYGSVFGAVNRLRLVTSLGAFFGALGGGLVGVVAGVAAVALPWSLLGLLAGTFLGPYVLPQRRRRSVSLRGAALGTCGGVLISAFRQDRARATEGVVSGAITGLAVAAGLFLLLVAAVSLTPSSPPADNDTDVEVGEIEDVEEEGEDHGGGLSLRRS